MESRIVREGLIRVLLGPGQLYEALRQKGGFGEHAARQSWEGGKPRLSEPIALNHIERLRVIWRVANKKAQKTQ